MRNPTLALEGQFALVTGGGSGIGLACARHLLRDGATVTIVGRAEEKLHAAGAARQPAPPPGPAGRVAVCDVTDEAAVEAAVRTAAPAGRLDIAVANAGGGSAGAIVRMSVDEWRSTLDVNLTGTFLTIKHARRPMAGAGGAIVALSPLPGLLPHRFMSRHRARTAGAGLLAAG